jgi:hypothetical protein
MPEMIARADVRVGFSRPKRRPAELAVNRRPKPPSSFLKSTPEISIKLAWQETTLITPTRGTAQNNRR